MKQRFIPTLILTVSMTFLMTCVAFGQAASPPAPAQRPAQDCTDATAPLRQRLDAMDARLKDWAQLNRYREANAALASPTKNEDRVVFLGDSITDNWSRPGLGGFFPDKPYINRGISGQTTPQMLVRFRPDVIALQPKVVVILAGTNDIAGNTGPMTLEETEANLTTMVELAHAHGIRVVLASLTPVSDYTHTREGAPFVTERRPPAKILELNHWIQRYAAEDGDIYLDYFTAVIDEKGFLARELSDDGLHPNAAGYALMAPLAERAIRAALAPRN